MDSLDTLNSQNPLDNFNHLDTLKPLDTFNSLDTLNTHILNPLDTQNNCSIQQRADFVL